MDTQVVDNFSLESPAYMPHGHVSREEAAKILGKSHAQLERYIRAEEVKSRLVPRRGRKAERVFLESSLVAIRDKQETRKAVRPPSQLAPKAPPMAAALAAPVAATSVALEKVAAGIVGFTSAFDSYAQRKPAVPVTEKLWLSLDEATEYSGLAREDLQRLAKSGALIARKSGGWKLQRKSLEAFAG